MPRLFGTDGIRGLANDQLDAAFALSLAQAAAAVLGEKARSENRRPLAVIGRDPRISGEFLSAAVAAGLAASGVDVLDAGVLPTPATAFLTGDIDADFGVMVSASHNPAEDNGIKFFAAQGRKLSDELEDEIEAALANPPLRPTGAEVGSIKRFADAEDRYRMHLLSTIPVRLDGLHVVLDTANGAAAGVSPEAFSDAGAQVTVIGAEPDGLNINERCGSTYPQLLQEAVVRAGADLGIAHDGDADRTIAVDAQGNIIDGDKIMVILALALAEQELLAERTLVATVMSNLGLKLALAEHNIQMLETAVGDRYVLAELTARKLSLGGEQSGHIIFSDYSTTGDGILTGLQLMARMKQTGKSLAELASVMVSYPQVMINVSNVDKHALAHNTVIAEHVAAVEAELAGKGRVLLRSSGTEPLVRVMVEAESDERAHAIAQRLAEIVKQELSL